MPYGPREPVPAPSRAARRCRSDDATPSPSCCSSAITAYAVFGGADFGAGFWDLIAGGAERGERPRALIDHSIGPVWEANHVWLIFCLVVLWTAFPEAFASITLTLFVPAHPRRARHRAARFELRLPQGRVPHPRPPQLRRRLRRSRRCSCPTAWARSPAPSRPGRVPAGGEAGDPWSSWVNPTSILGGVLAVIACAYPRRGLPGVGRPPARRTRSWPSTSAAGPSPRRSSPASSRSSGSSCSTPTPRTSSTASRRGRCRSSSSPALCGIGVARAARAREPPRRRGSSPSARSPPS